MTQLDSGPSWGEVEGGDLVPALAPELERRIFWRVIPLLFGIAYVSQLDRTNLAFAALQLDGDLGFSRTVHGLGAGLFFIGYLAQLPANVACLAFGVRRWLTTILLAWGCVAALGATISSRAQFLALRFALGLTEAGTYPAIYYQLSQFYDAAGLGVAYTWVATATAVAGLTGAPIAAGLLSLDGRGGLRGWKWLFLVEAVPALGLAVAVFLALPSATDSAWLSSEERVAISRRVHGNQAIELAAHSSGISAEGKDADAAEVQEEEGRPLVPHAPPLAAQGERLPGERSKGIPAAALSQEKGTAAALRAALTDHRLWWLGGGMMLVDAAMNAVNFWLPQIIRASFVKDGDDDESAGLSEGSDVHAAALHANIRASLLAALPFAVAGLVMVLNARHSKETRERRLHTSLPLVAAALALGLLPLATGWAGTAGAVGALTAAAAGIWATHGPFFSWPSAFLDRQTAALGFALVKTLGALGGFGGPALVGLLADAEDGDFAGGALLLAGTTLLAAAMTLVFRGAGCKTEGLLIFPSRLLKAGGDPH